MCSIFKYQNCVGRNFDYEQSYKEELRIVKRKEHFNDYKIIGMCTGLEKEYPLFYDAMNEHGLVCGGLAFEGNAVYYPRKEDCFCPASYDFIIWTLGNFRTVEEVKKFICDGVEAKDLFICDESYSDDFQTTDLHWFIADKNESIVVEQTKHGLTCYSGDVLTNNPVYWLQNNWRACEKFDIGIKRKDILDYDTRGKNTYNLKGDYTSMGRYQRLSWLKEQLEKSKNDFNPVTQSFHLLSSVEQIYGATPVDDKFEYTIYSIVYDMENKKVFLKFYDNNKIHEVKL